MASPVPSSEDLRLGPPGGGGIASGRWLVSIFVKVSRSKEEVKEEGAKRWRGGRQHVNEPAQCH